MEALRTTQRRLRIFTRGEAGEEGWPLSRDAPVNQRRPGGRYESPGRGPPSRAVQHQQRTGAKHEPILGRSRRSLPLIERRDLGEHTYPYEEAFRVPPRDIGSGRAYE